MLHIFADVESKKRSGGSPGRLYLHASTTRTGLAGIGNEVVMGSPETQKSPVSQGESGGEGGIRIAPQPATIKYVTHQAIIKYPQKYPKKS